MSEKELLDLLKNYKNKNNIKEKLPSNHVQSIEDLKRVFNYEVNVENLYAYKEAISYIITHLIDQEVMKVSKVKKLLLELNQFMVEVLEKKIQEHYWYDEHSLASNGLFKLKKTIEDIAI